MDYGGKRRGKKRKKEKKKKMEMWQVVSETWERVDVREIRKINVSCTYQ